MPIKEESVVYYLAVFFVLVLVLSALGGCAHKPPKTLEISCFVSQDSKTAKLGVEGLGPLLIVEGQAFYYDSDGILHRVKEAVCGVK